MSVADAATLILVGLEWAILGYFVVVNATLTAQLLSAAADLRRQRLDAWLESRRRLLGSSLAPRISMLAPAYDEEVTVVASVRSLLALQYPSLEIVVINDGSQDRTLEVLRDAFALRPVHAVFRRSVDSQDVRGLYRSSTAPALVVVDKANGGKADALNTGLNVATGELVCAMDSDTLVEPDALLRLVRPFLTRPGVVAAGGTIRAVNGTEVRGGRIVRQRAPRRLLAGLQAIEYLRAFELGRLGWNRLGGNLVVSGAFGLFDRGQMLAVGGYRHDTVGEDMEVVVRLRRTGYERPGAPHRIAFIPDPVAWTEVPERVRVLARQRERWHRGLADVLLRHRGVLLNPRYGVLGLVVVPAFWVVELLAPVVELVGLASLVLGLVLGAINLPFAIAFLLVAYGWGLLLSILAVVLDEWTFRGYGTLGDRLLLCGYAVLEGVGYRQLTAVWRLRGLVRHARGRSDWGTMTRRGFGGADVAPDVKPE